MADTYPRSPKATLGGIMHLGRMIDKVRLRHAGQIQDYNYLTAGFDKYLLDLLGLTGEAFERQVLAGGTEEELLAWVRREGKPLTEADIRLWNQGLLKAAPKDEAAHQRFQARLVEIAAKRGKPVESLTSVTTWVEAIELDEGRL
nr:DUF5069 domain-containing protein [Nitrospirota bacterium]